MLCLLLLFGIVNIAFSSIINGALWLNGFGSSAGGSICRLKLPSFEISPSYIEIQFIGLGHAEVSLNGLKIGNNELESAWSNYNKTCYFNNHRFLNVNEELDFTFGIIIGNGMYNVPSIPNRYTKFVGTFGQRKFIFAAKFYFKDGSSQIFQSGVSEFLCDTSGGPITTSHTYGGEDFDARLVIKGWDRGAVLPTTWIPATISNEGPSCEIMEQKLQPIKVQEILPVVDSYNISTGVVYDFGKNHMGWPSIKKVIGEAGSSVKLVCGELLDENEAPLQHNTGPHYFLYTLSGSKDEKYESWTPKFSFYGYRWCNAQLTGNVTILEIEAHFIFTDAPVTGSFVSSLPILNDIHRIVLESFKSNFGSIWMDCPHREKLGWLEAGHLLLPGIIYNFDSRELLKKILRDIAESQTESGLIPDISPEFVVFQDGFRDSPEWGLAFIFHADYLFSSYGDDFAIISYYSQMTKYMNYLKQMVKMNPFILDYGLGDWCDVNPSHACDPFAQSTKLGVTGSALFKGASDRMAYFAAYLGLNEDAEQWNSLSSNISRAFDALFYVNDTVAYNSQAANGMALSFQLIPSKEKENAALLALKNDIVSKNFTQTGGDIGHRFILLALMNAHEDELLLKMHTQTAYPSYGSILAAGATSLPEQWDGSNSQLHSMLGHIEEWFYVSLLGLKCVYKSCTISPSLMAMPQGQFNIGSYASPVCGKIEIRIDWLENCNNILLSLNVTDMKSKICEFIKVVIPNEKEEILIKKDGQFQFKSNLQDIYGALQ